MNSITKEKVYYIETDRDITFYSNVCHFKITLQKTAENYRQFSKVLNSGLYEFISLI